MPPYLGYYYRYPLPTPLDASSPLESLSAHKVSGVTVTRDWEMTDIPSLKRKAGKGPCVGSDAVYLVSVY